MGSRTYAQFCGLAAALDAVGDRWALLIVRDLLAGPRRYSDLRRGLPGISTDMLATRLSELEAAGIVARNELPPPGAAKIYELTEDGRNLTPTLHGLARWGIRRLLTDDGEPGAISPDSIAFALHATYTPTAADTRRIRFTVDDHVLVATLNPSGLTVAHLPESEQATTSVDIDVRGTARSIVELLADSSRLDDLMERNEVTINPADAASLATLAAFRIDPAP